VSRSVTAACETCGFAEWARALTLPNRQLCVPKTSSDDVVNHPSTHATILRTNSGSSCRWLRMIPSLSGYAFVR
jgi:hypothetical protein